jgi:hypothetical protein
VSDSSTLRWQRWLLSLCAIALIVFAFQAFAFNIWRGRTGLYHSPTPVPFHDIITGVWPGWPAAEAGIRPGDVVDLRAASAPDRWQFRSFGPPRTDRSWSYALKRGANERRVTFRPRHQGWGPSAWFWFAGALGSLVFATLIAWRRPWLIEARVLCLFLVLSVVETCLGSTNWITPWPKLDFAAVLLSYILTGSIAVLVYTTLFGWPLSPFRKIVTALAWLSLAFDLLLNLTVSVGTWSGALDLVGGPIGTGPFVKIWEPMSYAFILLSNALAFDASRGRERSLFGWTMAMPFVGYVASLIQSTPAFEFAANPAVNNVCLGIGNGAQFLTPFAIGYALLIRSRFSPMTAAAGTMA